MKVLTAKVVDGRLDVPEGSFQEGDTVTLLVPEAEFLLAWMTRYQHRLKLSKVLHSGLL